MQRSRKHTAWKKSRKFGDVHGGRMAPKIANGVFRRLHALERPAPGEEIPILLEDNPSRDFFFPLARAEVIQALKAVPKRDYSGITHVWLRRAKKTDYAAGDLPLAEFICGSGVRVIVLYPWPRSRLLAFGKRKPSPHSLRLFAKKCTDLVCIDGVWNLRWSDEQLRRFYIEDLLYHEIGHHVDWYDRQWSSANRKAAEEFADQYAMLRSKTAVHVYNVLEKTRDKTEDD